LFSYSSVISLVLLLWSTHASTFFFSLVTALHSSLY
jgi:hypothetical protein